MSMVLLALAPAVAIALAVILRDRYEPEPPGRLIGAFVAGAAGVLLLMGLRLLVGDGGALLESPHSTTRLLAWIIFVGSLEELAKLVVLTPFAMSSEANEPIDFIVYGVLVALGFATVENLMYVAQGTVEVGTGRAVLSVPAHAVFGSIMGLLLYSARTHPSFNIGLTLLAALVPGIVHGVWNFLLTGHETHQLLLVPFHLLLIGGALYALERTARSSPFRFDRRTWSRSPVRQNADIDGRAIAQRLRLLTGSIWGFQLLGVITPLLIAALWVDVSMWPLWGGAAVVAALVVLVHEGDRRDPRVVDVRKLVPAEAGGLTPEAINRITRSATGALGVASRAPIEVQLDHGSRRQPLRARLPMSETRCMRALPAAAFRLLETDELEALMCQRLALRRRLKSLPRWHWGAPLLVTWSVIFAALESRPLVSFVALFLWPAILFPFRMLESRLVSAARSMATHLADLEASRAAGTIPLANALLKLGSWDDHQLMLESHAGDLARAGSLDAATLSAAVAGAHEVTALDETPLDRAATIAGRTAVSQAATIGAATTAAMGRAAGHAATLGHLTANALTEAPSPHPRTRRPRTTRRVNRQVLELLETVDWREYDTTFRDGRLDSGELRKLIQRLRDNPDLPLFVSGASPEGCHGLPSTRDRVVFIAANAEDIPELDDSFELTPPPAASERPS